jgi:cell division septum initiation protein DivIVA
VSTADLDLFGPPDADGTYPRFTTVLRGYDPEQVRDYTLRLAARVEAAERELEETKTQRDAARKRLTLARDEAYNQLGQRLADVLRMADRQAEKIRTDAEEEAKQRVAEARQLAGQIEREAEEYAQRLRSDGDDAFRQATQARDDLLGGLSASRDLALADLTAAKDHLEGIVDQLGIAMDLARVARIVGDLGLDDGTAEEQEAPEATRSPEPSPAVEDILVRTEGFEILLPEFLLRESDDDIPGEIARGLENPESDSLDG